MISFNRYAIDNMQSASMEEAKKNGIQQLAEETTLVQFIFGGYLRSKVFFMQITQPFPALQICTGALNI
jgi:hypothetical protein